VFPRPATAIRPTSIASGPPYVSKGAEFSVIAPSARRQVLTRGFPCTPPGAPPTIATFPPERAGLLQALSASVAEMIAAPQENDGFM
jgi:hypothetical protein